MAWEKFIHHRSDRKAFVPALDICSEWPTTLQSSDHVALMMSSFRKLGQEFPSRVPRPTVFRYSLVFVAIFFDPFYLQLGHVSGWERKYE